MNVRTRRDDGFTLIELVVSIAMIGIIVPVLAAAFSVIVRTTPSVSDRTDDARTLQGVVTWLPQDVDSTPANGFDTNPAAASGCTASPGTNLLRMEWSEDVGTGLIRYVTNYRHVLVGSSYYIQRVTCSGVGAGPLGGTSARGASSAMPELPPGWAAGQLPFRVNITRDAVTNEVTVVSFEVQTLTGKILRIDSAPKNPANTLPPTTTGPVPTAPVTTTTTVPTTTTTVPSGTTTTVPSGTTTTAAPTTTVPATTTTLVPCQVLTATLSPASRRNTPPDGNGNSATGVGVLADSVTLSITTSGVCTGLEARPLRGAPNGQPFRNFSPSGAGYIVVFDGYPQGSSELWADGFRPITIHDAAGGPYATVTLEVR